MGINELLVLKNILLRTKLETGLGTQPNLVLIPKSLQTPLFTPAASEHQLINEETLGELNPIQIEQTQTIAPTAQNNPIINPDLLVIESEIAKTNLQETVSATESKQKSSEDQSTEKPRISLGPVLNIALPMFSPLPGLLLNVINTAQQGNDTEENKHKKSQAQDNGSETNTDSPSENKPATSLWDNFTNFFKPITKPFTQLLDGFTKRVKDFMSLFNDKNKDLEKSSEEAKRLEVLTRNEQTDEASRLKREVEQQRYKAELEKQRQEQLRQERATQEAITALDQRTKQAELERQTVQRHEEQVKVLEPVSTKKTPHNELITRMIKQANAAGIPVDDSSFSPDASLSDVQKTIETAMINDPSAGVVYLASLGKNLSPIFESMINSANSANISRVLNQCLTSASGTFALKSNIDEYLTQQRRSSIIQA